MRKLNQSIRVFGSVCGLVLASGCANAQSTEMILNQMAEAYIEDPTFTRDWLFGVDHDGEMWTVTLDHGAQNWQVTRGAPDTPTFYFTAEGDILQRIADGRMTALTAMGKAFADDPVPMDLGLMEGAAFDPSILPFIFHFWTQGSPEVVDLRSLETRFVHGANMGVLYYQPGFRSAFARLLPGQHANEDPESRTNQFQSMLICLDGQIVARIDGEDSLIDAGQMIFIPAGVSHEFLNRGDAPAEALLFMFGDGA